MFTTDDVCALTHCLYYHRYGVSEIRYYDGPYDCYPRPIGKRQNTA